MKNEQRRMTVSREDTHTHTEREREKTGGGGHRVRCGVIFFVGAGTFYIFPLAGPDKTLIPTFRMNSLCVKTLTFLECVVRHTKIFFTVDCLSFVREEQK